MKAKRIFASLLSMCMIITSIQMPFFSLASAETQPDQPAEYNEGLNPAPLYYTIDGVPCEKDSEDCAITLSKWAEHDKTKEEGRGNYKVHLRAEVTKKVERPADTNVVFMLDASGSMNYCTNVMANHFQNGNEVNTCHSDSTWCGGKSRTKSTDKRNIYGEDPEVDADDPSRWDVALQCVKKAYADINGIAKTWFVGFSGPKWSSGSKPSGDNSFDGATPDVYDLTDAEFQQMVSAGLADKDSKRAKNGSTLLYHLANKTSSGTRIDLGIANALDCFKDTEKFPDTDAKQVLVIVTDGQPDSGLTNNATAWNTAKKQISDFKEAGGTVYLVGFMYDANGTNSKVKDLATPDTADKKYCFTASDKSSFEDIIEKITVEIKGLITDNMGLNFKMDTSTLNVDFDGMVEQTDVTEKKFDLKTKSDDEISGILKVDYSVGIDLGNAGKTVSTKTIELNKEATFNYTDSKGDEQHLEFPVPKDTVTAATLNYTCFEKDKQNVQVGTETCVDWVQSKDGILPKFTDDNVPEFGKELVVAGNRYYVAGFLMEDGEGKVVPDVVIPTPTEAKQYFFKVELVPITEPKPATLKVKYDEYTEGKDEPTPEQEATVISEHYIRVNANGGTWEQGEEPNKYSSKPGVNDGWSEEIEVPAGGYTIGKPSRDGYIFTGWEKKVSASSNEDCTWDFVAHWELDAIGPKDNIPDKYQKVITYKVVNGKFTSTTGFTKVSDTEVTTIATFTKDDGSGKMINAEDGKATVNVPADSTMKNNTGYDETGSWDTTLGATLEVSKDTTDTYTFTFPEITNVDLKYNEYVGNKLPPSHTESIEKGTKIRTYNELADEGEKYDNYTATEDVDIPNPEDVTGFVFMGWDNITPVPAEETDCDIFLKAIWMEDNKGGGDDGGSSDGIPDDFEIGVTFKIENDDEGAPKGKWSADNTTDDKIVYIELAEGEGDNKVWNAELTPAFPNDKVPTAVSGNTDKYIAKGWNVTEFPATISKANENEYVYTYLFNLTKKKVTHKKPDGDNTYEEYDYGTEIIIDPAGGTWTDSEGAEYSEKTTVEVTENLTLDGEGNPTREGYKFNGWTVGEDEGKPLYTANWLNKYKLSYNKYTPKKPAANDSSTTIIENDIVWYYEETEKDTKHDAEANGAAVSTGTLTIPDPDAREGYVFLGYEMVTAEEGSDYTLVGHWAEDTKGGGDDGDSSDGIPDEYQVIIKFKLAEDGAGEKLGKWKEAGKSYDGKTDDVVFVKTLINEDDEWDATLKVDKADIGVPADATPNEDFVKATWSPEIKDEYTPDVYVHTFGFNPEVITDPENPHTPVEYGKDIIVNPNGGYWIYNNKKVYDEKIITMTESLSLGKAYKDLENEKYTFVKWTVEEFDKTKAPYNSVKYDDDKYNNVKYVFTAVYEDSTNVTYKEPKEGKKPEAKKEDIQAGTLVRIFPNKGTWDSAAYTVKATETDYYTIRIDSSTTIIDPVREGYMFMGWEKSESDLPTGIKFDLKATWAKDGNKNNIPDIYEVLINFDIQKDDGANLGTWNEGGFATKSTWVELKKDGKWDSTIKVAFPKDKVPYAIKANELYKNDKWSPELPEQIGRKATDTETDPEKASYSTYDYEYQFTPKDAVKVIYPGGPTSIPYGDYIIVDPNGGSWRGRTTDKPFIRLTEDLTLGTPVKTNSTFDKWEYTKLDTERKDDANNASVHYFKAIYKDYTDVTYKEPKEGKKPEAKKEDIQAGTLVRIFPNKGTWDSAAYTVKATETDYYIIRIDSSTTIIDPVREGYMFMGWEKSESDLPTGIKFDLKATWAKDGNKNNIPDIYEVLINFDIQKDDGANLGTWNEGGFATKSTWVELKKDGKWDSTIKVAFPKDKVPYAIKANELYKNDKWSPELPEQIGRKATDTETDPEKASYSTYDYEYQFTPKDAVKVIYPEGPKEITYGKDILVRPNGGKWVYEGVGSTDDKIITMTKDLTLGEPTLKDYNFVKWEVAKFDRTQDPFDGVKYDDEIYDKVEWVFTAKYDADWSVTYDKPVKGKLPKHTGKVTLKDGELINLVDYETLDSFTLEPKNKEGGKSCGQVKVTSNLDIPAPHRVGYIFMGWNVETGTQGASKNLVAQWEADNASDSRGGDGIPDKYQELYSLDVINGIWYYGIDSSIEKATQYVKVTYLNGDGEWDAAASYTFTAKDLPKGMYPDEGYDIAKAGWNISVPKTVNKGDSAAVKFAYKFDLGTHEVKKNKADDSPKSFEHGTYIIVDPNQGLWNGDTSEQYICVTEDLVLGDPTREGFVFDGWSGSMCNTPVPGVIGKNAIYRYEARWLDDTNKDGIPDKDQIHIFFKVVNGSWTEGGDQTKDEWLTFDADGKADIDDLKSIIATVPVDDTYEAKGWQQNSESGYLDSLPEKLKKVDFYIEDKKTSEVTFTYWYTAKDEVTITFWNNEGDVKNDTKKAIPDYDTMNVDAEGGWWTNPDDGESYQYAPNITISQDMILDSDSNPTKTNAVFNGWTVTEDEGNARYTFTANWLDDSVGKDGGEGSDGIPDIYQKEITFKAINGTWTDNSEDTKVVYVTLLDGENKPSKNGKALVNVPTAVSNDDTKYDNGIWDETLPEINLGQFEVTGNKPVEYVYTFSGKYAEYMIEYYLQDVDGTYGNPYEVSFPNYGVIGTTVSVPEEKIFTGYQINKLAEGSKLSGTVVKPSALFGEEVKPLVLKAYYDHADCTVSYSIAEGVGAADEDYTTKTYKYGEKITIKKAPTRDGYTFLYWNDGTNGYQPGSEYTVTGDVEFTDAWTAKERTGGGGGGGGVSSYRVTFETNGGTKINPVSVSRGQLLAEPKEPTKEGESFVCWNKDEALSKPYDFSEPVLGSMTLYAKWTDSIGVADPDYTGVSKYLITGDHIKYLNGYPEGNFRPTGYMTRAEVAQMFYNLLRNKTVAGHSKFNDVPHGAWYEKAVIALANLGIMKGVGGGNFNPDAYITRAEFTATAMRFTSVKPEGSISFIDVPKDYWAREHIEDAALFGWITGTGDGKFNPDNTIERCAIARIVNNMLGRKADLEYVDAHSELLFFPDVYKDVWYFGDVVESTNAHDYQKTNGLEYWK